MRRVIYAVALIGMFCGAEVHAVGNIGFKKVGDIGLSMSIRTPAGHKKTDKRPAIIFFHGGGWVCGKANQFTAQARAFASRGFVAFSANYRVINKHKTTVYECVKDAKSAVRYVRAHAKELGIDPNKIVVGGGSAGGHLAACTAVIEGFEEEGEDQAVSSKANALVLFSPVLDTTDKGYGSDKMTKGKKTDLSPCHHVRKGLPPAILFHGTNDTVVPPENAERFEKLMKEAGNTCVRVPFKGRKHNFFNHPAFRKHNKIEDFEKTITDAVTFLESVGMAPRKTANPEQADPSKGPKGPLHVYLLIGQSNMAGRAPFSGKDAAAVDRCRLLTNRNQWVPAKNPFNRFSTIQKRMKGGQRMNPGYTFARKMLENDKSITLGIVCNARGGTSINQWGKGTTYFKEAVRRAKEAMKTGTLKGIIWHQGESDSGHPKDYIDKLAALVLDLRKELGIKDLPFVAGEVNNVPEINKQISMLPKKVPMTDFIRCTDLKTMDRWHFDANSVKIMGQRYADKMLGLLKKKK